jgi:hypothetical protein
MRVTRIAQILLLTAALSCPSQLSAAPLPPAPFGADQGVCESVITKSPLLKEIGFWAGVQTGFTWTAIGLITLYLLFHKEKQ